MGSHLRTLIYKVTSSICSKQKDGSSGRKQRMDWSRLRNRNKDTNEKTMHEREESH